MHIESGIRIPGYLLNLYVTQYMVSPELVSSGNELKAWQKPDLLRYFAREPKTAFKFIITKPGDFAEVKEIAEYCDIALE